jgi:hypothetical protein
MAADGVCGVCKGETAMIRTIITLVALVACPDPIRVFEGRLCPGTDTRWYFTEAAGCGDPIVVSGCTGPPLEDPDNFASPPPIDHDFDEHSPTGPGPGPPGATTVDKP